MISFIWLSKFPVLAGTGGTENYTIGQIKELRRRGIPAQLVTIGLGVHDGRKNFPDIPFMSLSSVNEVDNIKGEIIFIVYPQNVSTQKRAHVILHCPLSLCDPKYKVFDKNIGDLQLMATSRYTAAMWSDHFNRPVEDIPVVYPFAEACFGTQPRAKRHDNKIKVLFAGRLTPDKGIYTLLAALHLQLLQDERLEFTATSAGVHTDEGKIIHTLLEAHPLVRLVDAQKTPDAMARLFAEFDIVVMPSTALFWKETFGIVSVEAQHSGCRVVAANSGGLSETDCGSLILVEPDNPLSLTQGIQKAASMMPVTPEQRRKASTLFTVKSSVDDLLRALHPNLSLLRAPKPISAA